MADAGVAIDIFGVEYITPDGRIQHTGGRIATAALHYPARRQPLHFAQTPFGPLPVPHAAQSEIAPGIRHFNLIESTYPVDAVGSFASSDARLDKIWEISARTLKLCMEDTFTDCPLYEQTHWVGDARNESLLAYSVFGATDLGRR